MQQRSKRPVRKVIAGTGAAALATLLTYAAARLWHVALPPDVAAAAAGLLVTVVGAVVSYVTPPAPEDAPVPKPQPDRRRGKIRGGPIP